MFITNVPIRCFLQIIHEAFGYTTLYYNSLDKYIGIFIRSFRVPTIDNYVQNT